MASDSCTRNCYLRTRADSPNVAGSILQWIGNCLYFIYYLLELLSLVSRVAPVKVNATMIGGFYEEMGPRAFWTMHTAIAATGGLLVLLLGRVLEAQGNITVAARA